jgi:hypothetical protein
MHEYEAICNEILQPSIVLLFVERAQIDLPGLLRPLRLYADL